MAGPALQHRPVRRSPEDHGAIVRDGEDREGVCGAERCTAQLRAWKEESAQLRPAPRVPQLCAPAPAGGEDEVAVSGIVAGEDDGSMPLHAEELLACLRVPSYNLAAETRGEHSAAAGGEDCVVERAGRACESPHLCAVPSIPDPCGAIQACGEHEAGAGGVGQRLDRAGVAGEGVQLPPAGHLQGADLAVRRHQRDPRAARRQEPSRDLRARPRTHQHKLAGWAPLPAGDTAAVALLLLLAVVAAARASRRGLRPRLPRLVLLAAIQRRGR
mmetsp:Transcript_95025/g.297182  ORF Transcript_95025/g.297182 Transcript_95025/m.297182 type:complete len:272 (-) Transcript_95025:295-1110(-)